MDQVFLRVFSHLWEGAFVFWVSNFLLSIRSISCYLCIGFKGVLVLFCCWFSSCWFQGNMPIQVMFWNKIGVLCCCYSGWPGPVVIFSSYIVNVLLVTRWNQEGLPGFMWLGVCGLTKGFWKTWLWHYRGDSCLLTTQEVKGRMITCFYIQVLVDCLYYWVQIGVTMDPIWAFIYGWLSKLGISFGFRCLKLTSTIRSRNICSTELTLNVACSNGRVLQWRVWCLLTTGTDGSHHTHDTMARKSKI